MVGEQFENTKIADKNYFSLICDLLNYIEEKKIRVGEKLPDEIRLSADLCASRPTLREALKVLEVFGIIDSKRGSGNVFVKELDTGITNLTIFYSLINGPEGHIDSISLRATIEASAVDSFIEQAKEEDYSELKDIYLGGLLHKDNQEKYVAAHTRFHMHLMKYYGNKMAKDFVASNIRMVGTSPYTEIVYENEKQREEIETILEEMREYDHDKVLQAVLSKDVNLAKSTLIQHILIPSKKYINQLK